MVEEFKERVDILSEPYHRFVFDEKTRKFIGKFEEMYRAEGAEGFDSWYQSDLTELGKRISLTILERYNFNRILDAGCGKGVFTCLLKKENNAVVGVDVSKTAIMKARRFRGVDFRVMDLRNIGSLGKFDLVAMMEVLSYIKDWREMLKKVSGMTEYLFVSLYLPENPIGFVKSFEELKREFKRYFRVEVEILLNNEKIFLLGRKAML